MLLTAHTSLKLAEVKPWMYHTRVKMFPEDRRYMDQLSLKRPKISLSRINPKNDTCLLIMSVALSFSPGWKDRCLCPCHPDPGFHPPSDYWIFLPKAHFMAGHSDPFGHPGMNFSAVPKYAGIPQILPLPSCI